MTKGSQIDRARAIHGVCASAVPITVDALHWCGIAHRARLTHFHVAFRARGPVYFRCAVSASARKVNDDEQGTNHHGERDGPGPLGRGRGGRLDRRRPRGLVVGAAGADGHPVPGRRPRGDHQARAVDRAALRRPRVPPDVRGARVSRVAVSTAHQDVERSLARGSVRIGAMVYWTDLDGARVPRQPWRQGLDAIGVLDDVSGNPGPDAMLNAAVEVAARRQPRRDDHTQIQVKLKGKGQEATYRVMMPRWLPDGRAHSVEEVNVSVNAY